MNFDLTEEQKMIASSAREIAQQFGPEYWRQKRGMKNLPANSGRLSVMPGLPA